MDFIDVGLSSRAPAILDIRKAWLKPTLDSPGIIQEHRQYARLTGRQMTITVIQAEWRREWPEPWQVYTLTVHGHPLKKDGTPSLHDTQAEFVEHGKIVQAAPDWLIALVNAEKPV